MNPQLINSGGEAFSEIRRKPTMLEPEKIRLDQILVVSKESKLEYDQRRLQISEDQLLKRYQEQGLSVDRILGSHQRQQTSLQNLSQILSPDQIINRNDISYQQVQKAKLVIALGGDNHFQFVAQFMEDGFIVGVNSDPQLSEGALTYYRSDQFEEILKSIITGDYLIEDWTRLEASLEDGRRIRCSGDFFIGELERPNMSRHLLEVDGVVEEQKGSGLLITTGANSTGWYHSENAFAHPGGNIFAKTNQIGAFLLTSPYRGKIVSAKLITGEINHAQQVTVTSLNDSQGVISADSLVRIDLKMGTKLQIGISPQPLKVLVINQGEKNVAS